MRINYRLEERASQAGNSGGTLKSAERHPDLFSADAPHVLHLGYSPISRINGYRQGRPGGRSWLSGTPDSGSCARTAKNLPKQLAELFIDRHEREFRFVPPLDSWIHFNGDRWCLDCGLHLAAARRLCEEAAHTLWNPHVDTLAMASALLRLASFNPKMTAAIAGKAQPMLEGLLAGKGVRHG